MASFPVFNLYLQVRARQNYFEISQTCRKKFTSHTCEYYIH